MNSRQRKALAEMRKMVEGQLKAKARIWGSIDAIPDRFRRNIGGMFNLNNHPEMSSIAPHDGEFTFKEFKIKRKTIDRMTKLTVWLA